MPNPLGPAENFQQPNPRGYVYPVVLRTAVAEPRVTSSGVAGKPWRIVVIPADDYVLLIPPRRGR